MAPKKKAAAAATAKEDDGEDESTKKLYAAYKKNCNILDIKQNARLKEMYEVEYCEEDKHFTKVSIRED